MSYWNTKDRNWDIRYTENQHIPIVTCTEIPTIIHLKNTIINTLTERARRICEPKVLDAELEHLTNALKSNGYSEAEIKRSMQSRKNENKDQNAPITRAFLPYIPRVTDQIGRLLQKENLKTIYKPTNKIKEYLRTAKDSRDPLSSSRIFRIPVHVEVCI